MGREGRERANTLPTRGAGDSAGGRSGRRLWRCSSPLRADGICRGTGRTEAIGRGRERERGGRAKREAAYRGEETSEGEEGTERRRGLGAERPRGGEERGGGAAGDRERERQRAKIWGEADTGRRGAR